MRRANLGNMFAPLLASGWINQLNAQTPIQQLMLKSEKYFMKIGSPTERKNRAFSSSGLAFDDSLLGAHSSTTISRYLS
jgi:hypothetical protein